jgi:hypothetical protein
MNIIDYFNENLTLNYYKLRSANVQQPLSLRLDILALQYTNNILYNQTISALELYL